MESGLAREQRVRLVFGERAFARGIHYFNVVADDLFSHIP